ncbi:hydroxyethylthiazole kinase [Streptomyces spectabilis]|uniref:hydroxyethylthiazole kinase n=1 Tax=Streptomyces spectabilis TaxID=68270 RepID=UPI0033E77C36
MSGPTGDGPTGDGPIATIRERRPLVHMITNLVSMAACAQTVKSLGAATIFAHVPEEAAEIAESADAVVLNVGTSVPGMDRTVLRVAEACAARSIPVVLDPLGSGASRFRSNLARALLDTGAVRMVSGNVAELADLCGVPSVIRGADAVSATAPADEVCQKLAESAQVVAAVSGRVDYVGDGRRLAAIANGHPVMGQVVGTGSARSAVLGAFAAVAGEDMFTATVTGVCAYGIAGELAAATGRGPGHFLAELCNQLSVIDDEVVAARSQVTTSAPGETS